MSKRYTFLLSFLVMTLLAVGCDMNSDLDSTDKDTADTGIVSSGEDADTVDDEIVSVERFMEYYGVINTDIPRDYILDFIMQYRFREDTLAKRDYWAMVSADYDNGVV